MGSAWGSSLASPGSVRGTESCSRAKQGVVKPWGCSEQLGGEEGKPREQVGEPSPGRCSRAGAHPATPPVPCKAWGSPRPCQGPLPSGICMENRREWHALPMLQHLHGGTLLLKRDRQRWHQDKAPLSSDTPNLHCLCPWQGQAAARVCPAGPGMKQGCFHCRCRSRSLPARGAALGKGMQEGIAGGGC